MVPDNALYDADLYLIGTGVFELRQITIEALEVMQTARSIVHLTSKHEQLCSINPNTENVGPMYWTAGRAWPVYQRLARFVVGRALDCRPTAFAVEGNPMFFNDICWEIVRLGKRKGLKVQCLPGVSSLDILPIQLGFDIGNLGTQLFEATELVMFRLSMNPYLSTLILQVAEFRERGIFITDNSPSRFRPLINHLLRYYPRKHVMVFIRSTSACNEPSVAFSTELRNMEKRANEIKPGMTLYVPRVRIPFGKRRQILLC